MAQTIKIKRSATSGNKLTGSNSIAGEIGMNTADKSLYIQTGSTDASVVTVYDDSILHLDDTNNRVGIGTTNPQETFHVVGTSRFNGNLEFTQDVQGLLYKPQESGSYIERYFLRFNYSNNNSYPYLTNRTPNGAVVIMTGGASAGSENEHFRIKGGDGTVDASFTNANVGIGNSSPSTPLHVIGTIRSQTDGASTFADYKSQQLYVNSGSYTIAVNGPIHFADNNNNKVLTVDNTNDRIGIGTTSPTKSLHLNYNSSSTARTGDGLAGGAAGGGFLIQNTNSGNNTYANLDFRASTADGRIVYQYTGTQNQGDFHFITDNTNSPATAMTIKNDGKVGIGTTAPQSKLEVNLASGASSSLMDANTVNDVQLIRAPFSSSAATTSNAGAKWGLRFVGRNDSNYDNQKSGAIYAVSEDSGAGYNRNVGLAFHTSGFDSNHTERMRISSAGVVSIYNSSNSTVPTNGALRITGGLGVGYNVHAGGLVRANSGFYVNTTQIVDSSRNLVNIGTVTTSGNIVINSNSALLAARKIAARDTNGLAIATSNGTERIGILNSGATRFNNAFTFPTTDGQANQVLQTDGSGNVSWASVSSAGASDVIADADGDTKIQVEESADEDKIRFDTAGIERFRIGSDIEVVAATDFNITGANRRINFTSGTGTVRTTGASSLHLATNNTNRISIDSNGRVGIGHSAANAQLHVNSGNNTSVSIGDATNPAIQVGGTTNYRFGVYTDNEAAYIENKNGDDGLVFRVKTAGEAMRIDGGTGNVGIGTDSPSSLLHIKDTGDAVLIVEADSDNTTETDNARIELRQDGNNIAGYLYTEGNAGQTATGTIANTTVLESKGGGNDVGIHFATGGKAPSQSGGPTNGTVRMTILGSGNVGIGTTNPLYALQVAGQIYANGGGIFLDSGYRLKWGNSQQFIEATNSGPMQFGTGNAERMRISNSGNVGIGTTSPSKELHVKGGVFIDYPNGSGSSLKIGRADTSNFWEVGHAGADFRLYNTASSGSNILFGVNNGGGVQNNNVGIGTANPNAKLQVDGTVRINRPDNGSSPAMTATLEMYGYEGRGVGLKLRDQQNSASSSSNREWFVGTGYAQSNFNIGYSATGSQSSYAANNKLTVTTSGSIGIGTSSPQEKLDVTSGHIQISNTSSTIGNLKFFRTSTNNGMEFRGYETLLTIHTVGGGVGEIARFQRNTGNVGIGTSSPNAKLQVEAAGIDTTTTTTSATTQVAIDTFAAATFRSARYTIQITNSTDSTYHITEVLLIHDGTTPAITEYGIIFTGSAAEATIDADILTGNVRLLATPASTDSMTFKVVRHCITV